MIKRIYSAVVVAAVLFGFASCKEQPVILGQNTESIDSTYVAAPETPQAKKVLATELTGVRCPNCPEGAEELETLNNQSNGGLVIVSLHSGVLTNPINDDGFKSKFDFRSDEGLALLNQIYGGDPGVKPSVNYNRLQISQNTSPFFVENYAQNWGPKFQEAMGMENPPLINLEVTSKFNEGTQKYDVRVKIAYNQSMSGTQQLNLFLTEDSIIDVQQTSDPFNKYDSDYVFNNVFRHAITGLSGQTILDSLATKEAGRVLIFNTSFTLNPPSGQVWNPSHMNIVAFVSENSGADIHVYQAAKTKLQ